MHALVILLHEGQLGFDQHGVKLFETETVAEEFAIDKLVEHGEIEMGNGGWRLTGLLERIKLLPEHRETMTSVEALEAFQDSLGLSEYFHIVEVA